MPIDSDDVLEAIVADVAAVLFDDPVPNIARWKDDRVRGRRQGRVSDHAPAGEIGPGLLEQVFVLGGAALDYSKAWLASHPGNIVDSALGSALYTAVVVYVIRRLSPTTPPEQRQMHTLPEEAIEEIARKIADRVVAEVKSPPNPPE